MAVQRGPREDTTKQSVRAAYFEVGSSARSTAAVTVGSGNWRRHSEKLATCWSHPSRMQGTHAPTPCTSVTLPIDWLPTRRHGEVVPAKSLGQGPHFTGLD